MIRIRVLVAALAIAVAAPMQAAAEPPRGAPLVPGYDAASLAPLQLSGEQRARLGDIERDLKRQQWKLIATLRELRWKQQDLFRAADADADTARRNFEAMSAVRREMFEAMLDARKKMEAILTREQRKQLAESQGARGASSDADTPAPPRER